MQVWVFAHFPFHVFDAGFWIVVCHLKTITIEARQALRSVLVCLGIHNGRIPPDHVFVSEDLVHVRVFNAAYLTLNIPGFPTVQFEPIQIFL